MKITLPAKKGNPNSNPIIELNQLVVVGANGSGKTRFGSRIEQMNLGQTHRISAQKSLSLPREVSPKSKKRAEKELYYGWYQETYTDAQMLAHKNAQRWGGRFDTHLLNDFDKLMVLLHTEEYEEALNYKEGRREKPVTKMDIVQKIWEAVLPHRKLFKKAGIIEAYLTGNEQTKYNASDLSDGERVIFYLVGEVVCAPRHSIIIIDEPEMHIHKSLVKSLFDLIEIEREDCSFIYLTHDIDFAFSRHSALKIWTKGYSGENLWDYEILGNEMPIPEQLYLEVLGSRKPILFLEGDNSSIDYELYQHVYTGFTLKPLGSCEKVIQSVKALNEQNEFHTIQSFGLIDRDARLDDEVENLISKDIWVLNVAEAENLFLSKDIVKSIGSYLGKNPDYVFDKVKENLIKYFNDQIEPQIALHYKSILRKKLISLSNLESKDINTLNDEIDADYKAIDKPNLLEKIKAKFQNVVVEKDYDAILRLFNLKNALIPNSKLCELIGIKNKTEYIKLVLSLLKKNDPISSLLKSEIDKRVLKKK